MGKIIKDGIDYGATVPHSKNLKYDNSNSGLESTNIQDAIDEVNGNVNDIHKKFITTDASGTVIESTELTTFLLRNISNINDTDTATLEYVNSANQNGSFIVSKFSDTYFSGFYFTPYMSNPIYFTYNDTEWTWEELIKKSDLPGEKLTFTPAANLTCDIGTFKIRKSDDTMNLYLQIKGSTCNVNTEVRLGTLSEGNAGWRTFTAIVLTSGGTVKGIGSVYILNTNVCFMSNVSVASTDYIVCRN